MLVYYESCEFYQMSRKTPRTVNVWLEKYLLNVHTNHISGVIIPWSSMNNQYIFIRIVSK